MLADGARDRVRVGVASVSAYDSQTQVDVGLATGAGGDVGMVDVHLAGVDLDGRITTGERRGASPVDRRTSPIEQSGLGEKVGAGVEPDELGTGAVRSS